MNIHSRVSLSRYLGLEKQSGEIKSIFRKFILIVLLENLVQGIASSFFILYIIDEIGFEKASIVSSVLLFAKLITDYPSGSLSDYIGQGRVLALSYLFYSTAIFVLIFAESLTDFMLVAMLLGLASAQSSGTVFSWLDNNYKLLANNSDPDNRIYAYAKTRSRTIYRTELGLVVLLGGLLSGNFSRVFVFKIEAVLAFIAIIISLTLLRERSQSQKPLLQKKANFSTHLKGGLAFFVSNKRIFFFLLGSAIYDAGWIVWISIILFPFYFGYTGSDQMATLLRSIIFFSGTLVVILSAKVSKKFSEKDLGIMQLTQVAIMLLGVVIIMIIVPLRNEFNFMVFMVIIIIFNFSTVISVIVNALESRIHVEMIPSEFRNSIYSLIPTLSALTAILILPLTGKLIQLTTLLSGVLIVFTISSLGIIMIHNSLTMNSSKIEKETTTGLVPIPN